MNIMHIKPIGPGYNIGNYAIALSVRKWLEKIYGEDINIITVPAFSPNLDSGLSKKTVYFANQICDGIVIGGGNLFENNELRVDLNALESLQVPLLLFSNSIGRIYGKERKLIRRTDAMPDTVIKALHEKASIAIERDLATYDHAKKLLPNANNIHLGGCPTLYLSEWLQSSAYGKKPRHNTCLIPIRNTEQMNVPLEVSYQVPYLIQRIADTVFDYGYEDVRIICNDQRDILLADSLKLSYYYTGEVEKYLELLASASLVVSFRVHGTLPCLALDTPVINISYDERSLSLLKTIGFSEWDINLVECDDVMSAVLNRINEKEKIEYYKKKQKAKWDELYATQEMAMRFLE